MSKSTTRKPNTKRNIEEDLRNMFFPEEVKDLANKIFEGLAIPGSLRKIPRKKAIFYCLHRAHTTLGITFDITELIKICGITKSDATSALTTYGPKDTVSKGTGSVKPRTVIKNICHRMKLDEKITNDIVDNWSEIENEYKSVSSSNPRETAAAYIMLELEKNLYEVDIFTYCHTLGISYNNVLKIYEEIASN